MSIEFLSFSYKIPSEPSKNRVYIWRALKNLGAIYLQQGVALLPKSEDTLCKLNKLDSLVKESFNGKSTLGKLEFINENDEKDIISEFTEQSKKEYNEFINNCNHLINEINYEIEKSNFNFPELEETEENLKKLKLWVKKIHKRNYFNLSKNEDAERILNEAQDKVNLFGSLVYEKENI